MIYVATTVVFLVCALITSLYFIGKKVTSNKDELTEKIKEAKVKKKRIEKLKSYSRTSYAKVPAMKRKTK